MNPLNAPANFLKVDSGRRLSRSLLSLLLQEAFYSRTISSEFILSNPSYREYLKNVDLEILFKYMSVKIISEGKYRQINLVSSIVKYVIAIIVILLILEVYGVNTSAILASLGVVGLVVGLALQDLIKDFIAGAFIIFDNQYSIGDIVTIENFKGEVISLGLKTTKLKAISGEIFCISNGQIVEVINRTIGYSKFRFTFAVDVDTDVDEIIKIVNETGEQMAKDTEWSKLIVDAPHYDEFGRIGKEGINVTVSGTTMPGQQWKVNAEYRKRLVIELQKSDITIADVE